MVVGSGPGKDKWHGLAWFVVPRFPSSSSTTFTMLVIVVPTSPATMQRFSIALGTDLRLDLSM